MSFALLLLFVTGLFAICAGVISGWRAGGRGIVLCGLINVSAAVGLYVSSRWENLSGPALAIATTVAVVAALATSRHPQWRAVRTLGLLGAAAVAEVLSLALLAPHPSGTRTVLLIALPITAIAFLATMARHIGSWLPLVRSEGRSRH